MKTLLHHIVLTGALPLVWGISEASGAVMTSISENAPAEGRALIRAAVEASDDGSYMMRYWNTYTSGTNRRREIGQSFVVPGTEPVAIDGFALRVRDSRDLSTVATGFTLSIYTTTTGGIPQGSPIYQQTGNLPAGLKNLSYITFLLDDTVILQDGTQYCLQIAFTSSSGAAQLSFAASSGDIYPEGRSFYYANSENANEMKYTSSQRDLDFTVLYTPVPEGKTAGLLLISLGALGGWSALGRQGGRKFIFHKRS